MRSAGDVASVLSQGDTIVIDEAQRFPDIGLTLKRLVDANEKAQKQVRIFATGSPPAEARPFSRKNRPLALTRNSLHVIMRAFPRK